MAERPGLAPAGDLAYVKLVGYLEDLGRRATVEEVEQYFAPYAPFRGLAGAFAWSAGTRRWVRDRRRNWRQPAVRRTSRRYRHTRRSETFGWRMADTQRRCPPADRVPGR
jgi:hypothetical protein